MKTTFRFGYSFVLALGLAACGSNTSSDDLAGGRTPDGAAVQRDTYVAVEAQVAPVDTAVVVDTVKAIDTGSAIDTTAADPYIWVVVQDTEQKACTTNGPGTDVDAVALWTSTGPIGWGKVNTATYTRNPGGEACLNEVCNGGNCKYAAITKTLDPDVLVAYTEGKADAKVNEVGDDTGYFSLNAGTLQIQMGDLAGAGPAREMKSGDMIKVFEVDKTYITSSNAPADCVCKPEKYTVALQTATGASLPIKPTTLATENTACTALTAASTEGCGTTVFVVP